MLTGIVNRCRVPAVLAAAALLLAAAACTRKEATAPVPGNRAPQFTLPDTEGSSVSLSAYKGKIVLLDFWATWCGPCKDSIPEIAKLHRTYAGRGVVILGISVDEGAEAAVRVKGYARRNGIPYRLLIDDGRASKAYRVRTIPATFLLDREQVIVESFPGYVPGMGERLAERIEAVLAGKGKEADEP